MATFAIESNGLLEKTAVYYNGNQIGGVKEVFLNLDEDGTFDAILQYEGVDKKIHSMQVFVDYLTNVKVVEPSFTEEEAMELNIIEVESDGDIESTMVYLNEESLEGIVGMFIHIKGKHSETGIKSIFSSKKVPDDVEFKAEMTFRNEDDTIETEQIF